jgi:hypothetical protein
MADIALPQFVEMVAGLAYFQSLGPHFFHGPIVLVQEIPRSNWPHFVRPRFASDFMNALYQGRFPPIFVIILLYYYRAKFKNFVFLEFLNR